MDGFNIIKKTGVCPACSAWVLELVDGATGIWPSSYGTPKRYDVYECTECKKIFNKEK